MFGRIVIGLVLAVLFLFSLSCDKLPEWAASGEGDIAFETLPEVDTIPLKWGNLVSVSVVPDFGYLKRLWFQDENGGIRMVTYDIRSNKLITTVRFIPRK